MSESNGSEGCRLVIDQQLCSGHGRCYVLGPDFFTADDAGYGQVVDQVSPASRRSEAEDVVDACPEQAISIVNA